MNTVLPKWAPCRSGSFSEEGIRDPGSNTDRRIPVQRGPLRSHHQNSHRTSRAVDLVGCRSHTCNRRADWETSGRFPTSYESLRETHSSDREFCLPSLCSALGPIYYNVFIRDCCSILVFEENIIASPFGLPIRDSTRYRDRRKVT